MNPVLSIIVAAYNAETTIKQVIDSVYSQDVDKALYELIIVNDGSKDKTGNYSTPWRAPILICALLFVIFLMVAYVMLATMACPLHAANT